MGLWVRQAACFYLARIFMSVAGRVWGRSRFYLQTIKFERFTWLNMLADDGQGHRRRCCSDAHTSYPQSQE